MIANGFSLEVQVNGHPLPEYPHDKGTFVEGRIGSKYELVFRNQTSRRVLVVLSVDGLSVMNGKEATVHDSGYVVDAYGTLPVPGWRLDKDSVAQFHFGQIDNAYASRMGKRTNIGVIGAAVFHEKIPEPMFALLDTLDSPTRSFRGGSPRKMGGGRIGTEFGERVQHRVREVEFDREDNPIERIIIRYDAAAELMKLGVDVSKQPEADASCVTANAFPGNGCPPPPGWSEKPRERKRRPRAHAHR